MEKAENEKQRSSQRLDLQTILSQKFHCCSYRSTDCETAEELLQKFRDQQCPHAEIYDPEKTYELDVFQRDFGHGVRSYRWCCCVHSSPTTRPDLIIIEAEEILSEQELAELLPHCQCLRHRSRWPFNLLQCACCVGCLAAADWRSPPSSIIHASRQAKILADQKKNQGDTSPSSCIIA